MANEVQEVMKQEVMEEKNLDELIDEFYTDPFEDDDSMREFARESFFMH